MELKYRKPIYIPAGREASLAYEEAPPIFSAPYSERKRSKNLEESINVIHKLLGDYPMRSIFNNYVEGDRSIYELKEYLNQLIRSHGVAKGFKLNEIQINHVQSSIMKDNKRHYLIDIILPYKKRIFISSVGVYNGTVYASDFFELIDGESK